MIKDKSEIPFIVAIDGPAASGKGTLARRLAEKLNLACLDTGKLYRAVAWQAIQQNALENHKQLVHIAQNLDISTLNNPMLLIDDVAEKASVVGAIPEVRQALYHMQRDFAFNPQHYTAKPIKGAVLDGRDMGTAIVPETPFKFFITASAEIRAKRRYADLRKAGHQVTLDSVLEDIQQRDRRDVERKASPLKMAADATIIDTTGHEIEESLHLILSYLLEKKTNLA